MGIWVGFELGDDVGSCVLTVGVDVLRQTSM